ncbi:sigma-70 family RNA polymerase sigma factor [Clostridium sp. MSJ-4]|uniref:Sigma-70 family RNA polymerase sigma factor n=1 Tax=Clostridium simiarum TaxID=2841506 RepID=A0ABS6F4H8_9CLOT|nr:sigma-70 family RNA polymerase sigma factor [Clostridium simiarum]MBU5593383.1 sigma-70 family RNA polymerase sigma factor [Clostridium simiarum]
MVNLYEKIKNCQCGNKEDILFVLNMFEPLLNKYSRLLEYDDAKQELTLTLIKTLQKIPIHKKNFKEDKYIISYIKKSIINRYVSLSKKLTKKYTYEAEFDSNLMYFNDDDENIIELYDLLKDLTRVEKNIIVLKYLHNMSDVEIAELHNISRQAVNQTKNRALNKLKSYI